MAAQKDGKGQTVNNDLYDIAEAQPIARANSGAGASTFTPDAALLDKIRPILTRTGAFSIPKVHATFKDGAKAGALYLRHAMVVAEQMDPPKSAGLRYVDTNGNPATAKDAGTAPYTVIVQLTHKRTAKETATGGNK